MKTITVQVNLKNLEERDLFGLCMGYALKDVAAAIWAGQRNIPVVQAEKEIDERINVYFERMKIKFAGGITEIKLTSDEIKWLLSDDPNIPKPQGSI